MDGYPAASWDQATPAIEDKVITDSAAPILGAQRQPPHLR